MIKVRLTRVESGDQGTFGRIQFGSYTFFTGELPWRDNASNISCIPVGAYPCQATWSPAFQRQMILVGRVRGRLGVRIHPANLMGDKAKGYRCQLNGCIALSQKLGWMEGQKALLISGPAVRTLESYVGGELFELEIVNG